MGVDVALVPELAGRCLCEDASAGGFPFTEGSSWETQKNKSKGININQREECS